MKKTDQVAAIEQANGEKLSPDDYTARQLDELRAIAEQGGATLEVFQTQRHAFDALREQAEESMTRVEYTGQTAGSIRLESGTVLVTHIEPSDVLEPEGDEQRAALLATGYFTPTRKRATTDTTTDAPIESAVPDPQESA
ncbi:hypothetical protein [Deinococcus frigens]|uniref:hypothetical protein n=1 Tax=Deinococcus frigens TaxID=249403 RepID=UPI000498499D|nr:hypothetical protein [Deinococcus frigens]